MHDIDMNTDTLASFPLGALAGATTASITWDGMINGELHGRSVIVPVIEMVDSHGASHFHMPKGDYYIPELSISRFPVSGGGQQNVYRRNVWQNTPHRGVFGSDSMIEPVLLHHKLFPNLVNLQPIFGRTESGAWIPFEEGGIPWTETGNAWMQTVGRGVEGDEPYNNHALKRFSVRRLPQSSVAYLNQHANAPEYSVESYEASAAHGEVVHARFELDRDAKVSISMLAPDGQAMPLYYRDETTGNYVNAANMNCLAGLNDLEFYPMDYSNPSDPKILDNSYTINESTWDSSGSSRSFASRAVGLTPGNAHGYMQLREVNGNIDNTTGNSIGDRKYYRYWRVKFEITDYRTGNVRTKWALVKAIK